MKNGMITDEDGNKRWYINGKYHRDNGPAIEWASGEKHWYINGKRHREDGAAIEYADGYKSWYINGLLHRKNGPAIECVDGTIEYWLEGEQVKEEDVFPYKFVESRSRLDFIE